MLTFDVSGKRALVTGASSGLGRHFARVLAEHGAEVTLAARRVDALNDTRASIEAAGGTAHVAALDVADAGSVASFFNAAPTFDIVINNAGISRESAALKVTEDDWNAVIDTNLSGVFRVAQGAARAMTDAGNGGSIVNIASILGHRVAGGLTAYATSKAAVVQMTRSLALEWARHGIRVNAICPGYIETDINRDFFETEAGQKLIKRIPQRRLGQPDDLDGALMLLASDAGRFMTGADIVVDGGHLVTSL